MSLLRINVGMAVTVARTAGSRTAFALAAGSSKQPEKTTQARK